MYFSLKQHQAFKAFIGGVKDQSVRGAILARLSRLECGNPGDHASVGDGVFELRIHLGAGWRIYYGQVGQQIILLVGGGTKNGQQRDIDVAKQRLNEYRSK